MMTVRRCPLIEYIEREWPRCPSVGGYESGYSRGEDSDMLPLDQPPPIVCSIVERHVGQRVQIRGRAVGSEKAQGIFSLQVV
jgi:hypothetical protein